MRHHSLYLKPHTLLLGPEWHQALYELEGEGWSILQLAGDLGEAIGTLVSASMVEHMSRRWEMALMTLRPPIPRRGVGYRW